MIDKTKAWFKYYDDEVPHTIIYPPVTVKQLFNSNAEQSPQNNYIIINDITINYEAANSMARKLANGLLDSGIKKGDRIAIMSPNVPQFIISFQACAKIGAIVVPINPLAKKPEIQHYLKDSGAKILIVMAMFSAQPIELLKESKTPLEKIITFQVQSLQVDVEKHDSIVDYNTLIDESVESEPEVSVKPSDTLMLQYTGGTTGVSKGCVLLNKNVLALGYQENYWLSPIVAPDEELITLAAIPLYHIYGFNTNINFNLVHGGTIVLVPQPSTDNILAAVNTHEPNFFAAVPTMIIGLNQHPDISTSKIKSINGMISGSAPLAVEALRTFEKLSGAVITEGYGMSETSNVLTCNPINTERKAGSVGLPFPDNEIKIVDLDTGLQEMPSGKEGEVIARGPSVMLEYWNNPGETANSLRDGWLFTGDIGYLDEDGYLFIVDRKKDMILASGFNVYPREIDELMYTHPKILNACAYGIPDEKRGETIKLALVLKPECKMTEEEVIEFCSDNLSAYKVPKIIEFVNEIPLTSVGKVDRKELKNSDLKS